MRFIGFILLFGLLKVTTLYADIFSYELSCSNVNQAKFISFFNQDIKDKIINITPDFCLDEPKNEASEKKFNQLFSALEKRSEQIKTSESAEAEPFLVVKSLLLNRLWSSLTNKQRHYVFGVKACTQDRAIYQGFMDFKKEKPNQTTQERVKSEKAFEAFKEICALGKFESLLPYFDKGLLLEYFFVVNLAKLDFKFHKDQFCEKVKTHEDSYILGSHAILANFDYAKFKKNTEWLIKTDLYNKDSYLRELTKFADTKKVNPVYMEAIKNYTSSNYVDINNCLRGKRCENNSIEEIMQINKGLKVIKRKEMITFRGVSRLPDSVERKLKTHCLFSDPAFSSTSLRYEIARSFLRSNDGYMFVIRGKSGALIQDLSTISGEEEVLYPAGARFVVEGKNAYYESDTQMEIRTIYLRELEPFEKVKDCSRYNPKTDDEI